MPGKKKVMIYVEPDLWKDIKRAALEADKSASQYLVDCHRENGIFKVPTSEKKQNAP